MTGRSPLVPILAVCGLLLAAGAGADEPACVTQCNQLAEQGKLSASVSRVGCYVRVCQLQGRRLYQDGRYTEALAAFEFLADKLDASPSYHLDRGLTLYAMDRLDEALRSFDRVVASFPRNVRAGDQRGHTLVRLGRLDEARKQFEALREEPESEGEFRNLRTRSHLEGDIGVVRLMQGDVPGAKGDLARALEIDGRNKLASTYLYKVVPFLEAGVLDAAGVGELVAAYEDLALGRRLEAAKKFQALLDRQPGYAPGYRLLADILRSYQLYGECEQALRVGEAHLPQSVSLRAERLRCTLLRVGPSSEDAAPAVKELEELARAHPDNDRIKKILAAVGHEP